jgi:hypothetical protein
MCEIVYYTPDPQVLYLFSNAQFASATLLPGTGEVEL